MLNKLFSRTGIMERALDAAWLRNETISHNIANVDTPGYKRKTVSFEDQLRTALDGNRIQGIRTDSRHMAIGGTKAGDVNIKVTEDHSTLSTRLDGNNVDIEVEMAEMAKNTIRYNVLTQRLNGYFSNLKNVINGGGR